MLLKGKHQTVRKLPQEEREIAACPVTGKENLDKAVPGLWCEAGRASLQHEGRWKPSTSKTVRLPKGQKYMSLSKSPEKDECGLFKF